MDVLTSVDEGSFARVLSRHLRADYVYMYPPRQVYGLLERKETLKLIGESLSISPKLNLYFHFPFCGQICAYCNLFAVKSESDRDYGFYIDALCAELRGFASVLREKVIDTIYLGGGTPSLLHPEQFERLFTFLALECGVFSRDVPEVALEVAPETVELTKFRRYREIGINRVNIGVQSVVAPELASVGRSHDSVVALKAIEDLQTVGFRNICVDLIYGLEGQTSESWLSSVETVIAFRPNTICTYALTVRPFTGYGVRGCSAPEGFVQYERYALARELLLGSGYVQESPVRYICNPDGGYRQKRNHWRGENVLGFGAGARSYLHKVDLRNGYSVRQRRQSLNAYLKRAREGLDCWTDGFVMTEEEQARKTLVLGLECLRASDFLSRFGAEMWHKFDKERQILLQTGMLSNSGDIWSLTEKGLQYRDLSVQLLFSPQVRTRLAMFDYDE